MAKSAMAKTTVPGESRRAPIQGRDTCVRELDSPLLASRGRASGQRQNKSPHHFTKLSVLIAVYNEEATLWPCVQAVLAARLPRGLEREIVLVDDGSTDGTWAIAQRLAGKHAQVRLFRQPANRGK